MNEIKVINFIQFAENITGIYRNYVFYSNNFKKVIFIRIVLELVFYAFAFINCYYCIQDMMVIIESKKYIYMLLYCIVFVADIMFVIFGFQKTNYYKSFMTNLMAVHCYYNKDTSYVRGLKRLLINFLISFPVFVLMKAFIAGLKLYQDIGRTGKLNVITITLLHSSTLWHAIHFYLEYFGLYTFLTILSNLLSCLNATLSQIHEQLKSKENKLLSNDKCNEANVEEIKKWAKMYDCIAKCGEQLSACFQYQMLYSLGTCSLSFIILAYTLSQILLLEERRNYVMLTDILWTWFYYVLLMYIIFSAGQRFHNETTAMNRAILRLNSLLSINPDAPETKAVKNLFYITTTKPIKVEFVKVGMGNYLIPMSFSITVTYAIIALQFNNVI